MIMMMHIPGPCPVGWKHSFYIPWSFFGPNGLRNVENLEEAQAKSMPVRHPLVMNAISTYKQKLGDGVEKMAIILNAAVGNVVDQCHGKDSLFLIEMSSAFATLGHSIQEELLPNLIRKCGSCSGTGDLRTVALQLLNTCWISDGCFKQRKWLTELSTDLLFPRGAEKHLHYTEKNIETLTVHVPGVQSSESQVLQGFIVDGVVVSEPHYRASSTDSNFKALVLLEELWWGDELRSSKLRMCNQQSFGSAARFFTKSLKCLLQRIHDLGVKLILCGSKIPPPAVQLLREYDILGIEMVSEDLLHLIAESAGVSPLTDVHDMLSVEKEDLIQCLQWKYILIGSKRLTNLQIQNIWPCSIVLCGATAGLCKQQLHSLKKGIKCLKSWFKQIDGDGPFLGLALLPGGGAWEMALSSLLLQQLQQKTSKKEAHVLSIKSIVKGLLAVAMALHTSSSVTCSQSHLKLFYNTVYCPISDLIAIDCAEGGFKKVTRDWKVWEPYWSQNCLLQSVTGVMSQLFKLSHIVPVHRQRLTPRPRDGRPSSSSLELLQEEDQDEDDDDD